jgi:butyrate kinase
MICRLLRNVNWLVRHDLARDWRHLMATVEQFGAALDAINAAILEVAAEVERLKAIIAGGGLSAEQEAVILGALSEIEVKLKAIAAEPPPGEPA